MELQDEDGNPLDLDDPIERQATIDALTRALAELDLCVVDPEDREQVIILATLAGLVVIDPQSIGMAGDA
jgi:hypothetical protein